MTELTDLAGKMVPPLILDTVVVEIEDKSVLVAEIPECDYRHKPCFYGPSGMQTGAFLRVGNQSRRMTPYEVFSFVVGRGQPTFDRDPVKKARALMIWIRISCTDTLSEWNALAQISGTGYAWLKKNWLTS